MQQALSSFVFPNSADGERDKIRPKQGLHVMRDDVQLAIIPAVYEMAGSALLAT
jgi:hypothetical protein